MSAAEIALLVAAGAGAAVFIDPVTKQFPAATPANASVGYARCVNPDGSVLLTAFHFDGARTDVLVPAPKAL